MTGGAREERSRWQVRVLGGHRRGGRIGTAEARTGLSPLEPSTTHALTEHKPRAPTPRTAALMPKLRSLSTAVDTGCGSR